MKCGSPGMQDQQLSAQKVVLGQHFALLAQGSNTKMLRIDSECYSLEHCAFIPREDAGVDHHWHCPQTS